MKNIFYWILISLIEIFTYLMILFIIYNCFPLRFFILYILIFTPIYWILTICYIIYLLIEIG